jgi:hypothetical protein
MAQKRASKSKKPDQDQTKTLENQDLEELPFDEYSEAYYFELSPADLSDDAGEDGSKKKKKISSRSKKKNNK